MPSRRKKIRAELRKKHDQRTRRSDLTRHFNSGNEEIEDDALGERISGKGELTRKRTVIGESAEQDESGLNVRLHIDEATCQPGRVLRVHGLASVVRSDEGRIFQCATRGLLKNLSTDQRNVVAAGDRVLFRGEPSGEGMIERIEPRTGVLCRTSRGRQHVIVANVDQLLIITSAAEPRLKPNLIDRLLVTAEKAQIKPTIVINKVDLVSPADLQPLVGVYGQMGYEALLLSAETGFGLDRLQRRLMDSQTVLAGQSGVGKSSLLNAVDENLNCRVGEISTDNRKGRHTTTTAQLLPLSFGGYVVDTPGVRQFQLWDVIPEEVAGFYRDLRPYVFLCRYPNCTHTHEAHCAIKDAVADGRLDVRRYESYCGLFAGDDN